MATLSELAAQAQSQAVSGQEQAAVPAAPAEIQSSVAAPSSVSSPVSPAPEASSLPSWAKSLAGAGVDLSQIPDEQALATQFLAVRNELDRVQPLAQYGRNFAPYADQFRRFLSQQGQPAPAEQQESKKSPASLEEKLRDHWAKIHQVPKYDSSWESMVTMDDAGRYVGVDNFTPIEVVNGMNTYRQWRQDFLQQWFQDPFSRTWEALRPGIEDLVSSRVQDIIREQHQQAEFDSLESQYADAIYDTMPDGTRKVNPVTGQPELTPFGGFVLERMRENQSVGITDPTTNLRMAIAAAKAFLYDSQQASGSADANAHQQAPASPASMYAGAPPAIQAAVSPQQTFLDRARNVAQHAAVSGASPVPPSGTESLDMDNFFTSAARAARAVR